jgi:hypothetical protein
MGILDHSYIFHCISQNKIMDFKFFLIPEKSKELEMYIKAK